MAIDWMKEGEAVVIGVVDRALRDSDVKAGGTRAQAFKGYSDYFRIGATVVGLGAQAFAPKYDKYAEPLALVGTALLVETIWNAVKKNPTASNVAYSQVKKNASQRWPAPEYQNQFNAVPNLI